MKHLLSIAVVLILTAGGVRAQPAGSITASKVTVARQLYDSGIDAVGKDESSLAYERFKASYELAPRVLTLFNLAGAQAATGRLVEAIESYRKFLRDTDDGRFTDLRTDATNQLELLRKQIAHLTLEITNLEPNDVIVIDEIEFPRVALREAIPINPGTHVARIQRGTTMLTARTIPLTSGDTETVRIELPVMPPDLVIHKPPGPSLAITPAAPPKLVDHGASHSWLRSRWLWAGVAVVAAGATTGAYLLTRPDGVIVK